MAVLIQSSDVFAPSYAKAQKVISKADANDPQKLFVEKSDVDRYVNLMSTALSDVVVQMGKVLDALVTDPLELQGHAGPIQPGQIKENLHGDINRAVLVLSNIREYTFQAAKQYEDYWVDTSIQPITAIPEMTAANINTSVPDSCLKHCLIFKGSSGDQPEELQAWFQSIFDCTKTSGLTRATTIKLLQRRCTNVARTIIDQFIETLDDLDADDALLKVTLFMESKYSLGWSASVCKAELQGLAQKYKGTKNYVALQAKIVKLAHLASLGEPKEDREVFLKSNELPIFQSCLSSGDKDILLRLETQRKNGNLPLLTLSNAVNSLLTHHAARQAQQQIEGTPSINSLDNNVESEQVLMAQQQDVQFKRSQQGRSASSRRQTPRSQSRGRDPGQNRQMRPGDLARAPSRPRRQGEQPRQRHDQLQNQSDRNGDQPLWKRLGISKFTCPRCCSNGHYHINDNRCPFANTPIPPSPCSRCLKSGFHFANLCEKITQPPVRGAGDTRGPRSRGRGRTRGTPSSRGRTAPRSAAARRLSEPVRRQEKAMMAQEASDNDFQLPETGFYLNNNQD